MKIKEMIMAETKYEPKPGQGSAWPNDRKSEDWHADYRGKILLPDGTEHWVDVWDKVKADGVGFRTIKIGNRVEGSKPAETRTAPNHNPAGQVVEELDEIMDDIPF
jgi:hypothetical protein